MKTTFVLLLSAFVLGACSPSDSDDSPLPAAAEAAPPEEKPIDRASLRLSMDVAKAYMDIRSPVGAIWTWTSFVLMYGIWDLYEVSGDDDFRDYVEDYLDSHYNADIGLVGGSDNLSSGALAILECEAGGDQQFCDWLLHFDTYFDIQRRSEGGALWHVDESSPDEVWIDSLFMAGGYLLERGRTSGEARWWQDLDLQFREFHRLLLDSDQGLLNHAINAASGEMLNGPGVYWARGNSWYVAMLGRFLARMGARDPRFAELHSHWLALAERLLELQDDSGFWHTVLLDDSSYLEASATALFAYGIGEMASIGKSTPALNSAARKALDALDASVIDRKTLPQISLSTVPGDAAYYANVPLADNITYGLGGYFLASAIWARVGR